MTTQYTFSDELFSDLHKDAYGFRPSEYAYAEWDAMTDGQKQARWDQMIATMREEEAREAALEQIAIEKFDAEVMAKVAKTGKDSLEIIMEMVRKSDPTYHDPSHLCWERGMPMFYLTTNYGIR